MRCRSVWFRLQVLWIISPERKQEMSHAFKYLFCFVFYSLKTDVVDRNSKNQTALIKSPLRDYNHATDQRHWTLFTYCQARTLCIKGTQAPSSDNMLQRLNMKLLRCNVLLNEADRRWHTSWNCKYEGRFQINSNKHQSMLLEAFKWTARRHLTNKAEKQQATDNAVNMFKSHQRANAVLQRN